MFSLLVFLTWQIFCCVLVLNHLCDVVWLDLNQFSFLDSLMAESHHKTSPFALSSFPSKCYTQNPMLHTNWIILCIIVVLSTSSSGNNPHFLASSSKEWIRQLKSFYVQVVVLPIASSPRSEIAVEILSLSLCVVTALVFTIFNEW